VLKAKISQLKKIC